VPDDILATQDGLARYDQLAALGVTRGVLRWRLATGHWRQVLPAVYATFDGYLSQRQRWVAACLYAGPGAALTGRAALRLHGVDAVPPDPFVRVLVPHSRQVSSADFVRVHRTRRPDPHAGMAAPIRVCSLARAVADAARYSGDLEAIRALTDEVLDRRLVTLDELFRELAGGPTPGSALLRLVLRERSDGDAGPHPVRPGVLVREDPAPEGPEPEEHAEQRADQQTTDEVGDLLDRPGNGRRAQVEDVARGPQRCGGEDQGDPVEEEEQCRFVVPPPATARAEGPLAVEHVGQDGGKHRGHRKRRDRFAGQHGEFEKIVDHHCDQVARATDEDEFHHLASFVQLGAQRLGHQGQNAVGQHRSDYTDRRS
jgi:hypothetical protein